MSLTTIPYSSVHENRHVPGDTWQIGGKPYDPLDPGPYGSPGWYQDRRTGRHRRGELPDPLPPEDPNAGREAVEDEQPRHQFSSMRERAWERFLVASEPLARAHVTVEPKRGRTAAMLIRFVRWITAMFQRQPAGRHERPRWWSSGRTGTATMRGAPENRPRPRPYPETPYVIAWEHNFDPNHAFASGVVL